MALNILTGAGELLVDGQGANIRRHNLLGTGEALVEGTAHLSFDRVLSGASDVQIEGAADLVDVLPSFFITAQNSIKIRVVFDEDMTFDAALTDPASYTVTPLDGSAPVTVLSVTPQAVANPIFVDLDTTEYTNSGTYEVEVSNNVTDKDGLGIDPEANTATVTGIGIAPRLSSATATTSKQIRVVFDEAMDQNDTELANPANYTITPTGGDATVFVRSVELAAGVSPLFLDLVTSEMTDGGAYSLVIDSSGPVRDAARNPLDPEALKDDGVTFEWVFGAEVDDSRISHEIFETDESITKVDLTTPSAPVALFARELPVLGTVSITIVAL